MRNPIHYEPKPETATVHATADGGWYIALSHEATIYEVGALAYVFNVETVKGDNGHGELVLAPRAVNQRQPTQAEVEAAIRNGGRAMGVPSVPLAAAG